MNVLIGESLHHNADEMMLPLSLPLLLVMSRQIIWRSNHQWRKLFRAFERSTELLDPEYQALPASDAHIIALCAGKCPVECCCFVFFVAQPRWRLSLSLSVLLQSSSFLTWPCWAAARLCRGAAHLLKTRKRRSWCRRAAFYYKRSWWPFQKRTDPAFNPRWDKSRCEMKNRGCRKASETDRRAGLDVPECFPGA